MSQNFAISHMKMGKARKTDKYMWEKHKQWWIAYRNMFTCGFSQLQICNT